MLSFLRRDLPLFAALTIAVTMTAAIAIATAPTSHDLLTVFTAPPAAPHAPEVPVLLAKLLGR